MSELMGPKEKCLGMVACARREDCRRNLLSLAKIWIQFLSAVGAYTVGEFGIRMLKEVGLD
jgi:hypothetical protein